MSLADSITRIHATAKAMARYADAQRRTDDFKSELGTAAIWFVRALVDTKIVTEENYPSYYPAIRKMLADWDSLKTDKSGTPYPEFCSQPDKCRGLGCCPRDPCCCD